LIRGGKIVVKSGGPSLGRALGRKARKRRDKPKIKEKERTSVEEARQGGN
jgi:hypothetical protein